MSCAAFDHGNQHSFIGEHALVTGALKTGRQMITTSMIMTNRDHQQYLSCAGNVHSPFMHLQGLRVTIGSTMPKVQSR